MEQLYRIIETNNDLADFRADLMKSKYVSFDIETTGLDFFTDKLRLAQFCVNENIYIVNFEAGTNAENNFSYMIQLIKDLDKIAISHNSKFEIKFTYKNTGILLTNIFCTQTAEMALTAGKHIRQRYFSLLELVETYCNIVLDKEIRKKFLESEIITDEMLLYSANDVKYLEQIMILQLGEFVNLEMTDVYKLEMKLLPVVAKMEYDGVGFNEQAWLKIAEENETRANELRPEVTREIIDGGWDYAKENVKNGIDAWNFYGIPLPKTINSKKYKIDLTFLENLTSPTFIRKELIENYNIGSTQQLKMGLSLSGIVLPNAQKATLLKLQDNPTIAKLLEFKEVAKLVSTYGKSFVKYVHPVTKRIHPQFNQVGTVTGRWSSDSPNLQNIPHEARFRQCFIAKEGYKLVTADYSQAELRFVGAISNEQNIINAYQMGADIHAYTASIIFDKPIEDVTDYERSRGKTLNFSILYGSTAYGIAQKNPDITQDEADILLAKFFAGYPNLHKFIKAEGRKIWETKESRTPMGRIRFFEDRRIFADGELRRFMASVKREGFNLIIQGGSADALKIAMVYAFNNLPYSHEDVRFVLQVHDEVTIEVKEDLVKDATDYLVKCMEDAEQIFLGDIPAKADYIVGDGWSK